MAKILTQDQIDTYNRDGYIAVREVYTPAEVRELQEVTEEFVQKSAKVSDHTEIFDIDIKDLINLKKRNKIGALGLTKNNNASVDVGFYYSANALGRFIGTLLSGLSFQFGGLFLCLATSTIFLLFAFVFTSKLRATSLKLSI